MLAALGRARPLSPLFRPSVSHRRLSAAAGVHPIVSLVPYDAPLPNSNPALHLPPYLLKMNKRPVNLLDTAMLRDLNSLIKGLENDMAKDGKARGIVLCSGFADQSDVYGGGLDLREMMKSDMEVREFWTALQDLWMTLYVTPLVTVAGITGHTFAGHCLLAMSCDYRVACDDRPSCRIGLNEAKFGLIAPFWFQATMQSVVGYRRADKMLQLGSIVGFEEALEIGLVDELVPKASVIHAAATECAQWLSNGPAVARAMTKATLRGNRVESLRKHQRADTDWFVKIVGSPEMQRKLGAYLASLEKKKPAA